MGPRAYRPAHTARSMAEDMPSPWSEHPKLQGRFDPEFPDDLQVIVHHSGPYIPDRRPELVCTARFFAGFKRKPSKISPRPFGEETLGYFILRSFLNADWN
jgi:hypothetical protein